MPYDVIVIGGGPAGMIAAGRAGELGARVLLLEKNSRLGIKLLVTGNGRCNLANRTEDKILAGRFGQNGKFLFSSLFKFGVQDTIDFFESRGMMTKVEAGGRIFPQSDRAQDVLDILAGYLKSSGVEVRLDTAVNEIRKKEDRIEKVILTTGEELIASKYIIATGGRSYPATGSTGDAYHWLEELGHRVIKPRPALSPIVVKEKFVKELEGLSLKGVSFAIIKDNKKIASVEGEAIFTADGLSGPAIIDLSRNIDVSPDSRMVLKIDFFPSLDREAFDFRFRRELEEGRNKFIKNILGQFLPPKLIPVMIRLAQIDPETKANMVSREERKRICSLIKEFALEINGLKGFDQAMITAGGVDLSEVDPKTMHSKKIENLYLAGEILDLDGPTGGFNLQVCWTTGYVAGDSVT